MTREGYKKHKELIEAWANGADIEIYRESEKKWVVPDFYLWSKDTKHRIKPFDPKQGDRVLASYDGEHWKELTFVRKYEGQFVCIDEYEGRWMFDRNDGEIYLGVGFYDYAKPIK